MVARDERNPSMKFTTLLPLVALGFAVTTVAQEAPAAPQGDAPAPQPAMQGGQRRGGPGGQRGPGQRGQRGQWGGNRGGERGPGGQGGFRGGPMGGMGGMMGAMGSDFETQMFTRMITRPQFAKELGLSEDTINELNDSFTDIDVRILDLQTKLEEASKVQSDLLKATPLDEEAVMKAVDAVWELRKQIAVLQTQKLIVVLKTLTPEQTAKARELLQNRRGGFGRGPQGGANPPPPPPGGDNGNLPPPPPAGDGATPPPPPPAEGK